jgi:hypothetical protein
MANWGPLRLKLARVESMTLSWSELDALVGGLPASASAHRAFWSGDRSAWSGYTTADVQVGRSVTFIRTGGTANVRDTASLDPYVHPVPRTRAADVPNGADVLLVSCVKDKLKHPAPAQDLYVSDLFRKERAYAERSGVPWFILSAEHGLVAPEQVLAPYNMRLSQTSVDYRRAWGARVVESLVAVAGPLAGKTVEVHAGAAYVDPIRDLLQAQGAVVAEPLKGLPFGNRLAWYGRFDSGGAQVGAVWSADASSFVARLRASRRMGLTSAVRGCTAGALMSRAPLT